MFCFIVSLGFHFEDGARIIHKGAYPRRKEANIFEAAARWVKTSGIADFGERHRYSFRSLPVLFVRQHRANGLEKIEASYVISIVFFHVGGVSGRASGSPVFPSA